jgi:hypothetical protein
MYLHLFCENLIFCLFYTQLKELVMNRGNIVVFNINEEIYIEASLQAELLV